MGNSSQPTDLHQPAFIEHQILSMLGLGIFCVGQEQRPKFGITSQKEKWFQLLVDPILFALQHLLQRVLLQILDWGDFILAYECQ